MMFELPYVFIAGGVVGFSQDMTVELHHTVEMRRHVFPGLILRLGCIYQAKLGNVKVFNQVARKLEQFQKEFQCTHFIMLTQLPGLDPKKATGAFELFAKEVMPNFRKA